MKIKPLALMLSITAALILTSCGSASKKNVNDSDESSAVSTSSSSSDLEINGDSDSSKAGSLRTVFFGFNSSTLTSDAKEALSTNAEFLKENTDVEVQVEGHCDEKGGVQYNLALGENRAKAVKRYLTAMGVNSSRISTISFGKERPLAFGHDEDSWGQNRRGNFVITAK